jgi:hypothetical protein
MWWSVRRLENEHVLSLMADESADSECSPSNFGHMTEKSFEITVVFRTNARCCSWKELN